MEKPAEISSMRVPVIIFNIFFSLHEILFLS